MSESLTREVGNMTITGDSESSTQDITATESHLPITDQLHSFRIRITVPDEIRGLAKRKRRCVVFYGCDIPLEWFAGYADSEQPPEDRVKLSGSRLLFQIQRGLDKIRHRTGIKTLTFEEGLIDPDAPSDTYIVDPGRYGPPHVALLSLFTSERSSYKRRPSQEQVDLIAGILDRQPRWWVDYETYQ